MIIEISQSSRIKLFRYGRYPVFFFLIIFYLGKAQAGERIVNKNTDDGTAGTLRYEIDNAVSGDIITFNMNYPNTISLNGQIDIKESITIQGPGEDNLSISGADSILIFNVWGIIKVVKVNISGLTFEKGNSLNGGAIFNYDNLTLSNCIIKESNAQNGGAVANLGILKLVDCDIHSNVAVNGGGINNSGTSLTVISSYLRGNEATNGGAITNDTESIDTLINCVITGNKAQNTGGIDNTGKTWLVNCTVAGNTAVNSGGIRNDDGTVEIINTIIANNSATNLNDYEGNLIADYSLVLDDEGIQDLQTSSSVIHGEDPLFEVDAPATPTIEGNFMLQDGSPAINQGSPSLTDLHLPVDDINGNPRVAGDRIDMGAFESGSLVSVDKDSEIPSVFVLKQNFPNPFNPVTVIKYSIPNAAADFNRRITLKIYDLLGREVKTLVSAQQTSGNYESSFDASNLSSGIYYYQLKSGSFTETKKMVLMK